MKRVLIWLTFVFIILSSAHATNSVSKAKAMFIYNFARMVQWPGINSGDFIVGVYDKSDVTEELNSYFKDKKVYGQKVVIKEIDSIESAKECRILFIPMHKSFEINEISSNLSSSSVLIISEKQNLIEEGAGICFKLEANRLKYQFNPENLTSRNLIFSKSLQEMSVN